MLIHQRAQQQLSLAGRTVDADIDHQRNTQPERISESWCRRVVFAERLGFAGNGMSHGIIHVNLLLDDMVEKMNNIFAGAAFRNRPHSTWRMRIAHPKVEAKNDARNHQYSIAYL